MIFIVGEELQEKFQNKCKKNSCGVGCANSSFSYNFPKFSKKVIKTAGIPVDSFLQSLPLFQNFSQNSSSKKLGNVRSDFARLLDDFF